MIAIGVMDRSWNHPRLPSVLNIFVLSSTYWSFWAVSAMVTWQRLIIYQHDHVCNSCTLRQTVNIVQSHTGSHIHTFNRRYLQWKDGNMCHPRYLSPASGGWVISSVRTETLVHTLCRIMDSRPTVHPSCVPPSDGECRWLVVCRRLWCMYDDDENIRIWIPNVSVVDGPEKSSCY